MGFLGVQVYWVIEAVGWLGSTWLVGIFDPGWCTGEPELAMKFLGDFFGDLNNFQPWDYGLLQIWGFVWVLCPIVFSKAKGSRTQKRANFAILVQLKVFVTCSQLEAKLWALPRYRGFTLVLTGCLPLWIVELYSFNFAFWEERVSLFLDTFLLFLFGILWNVMLTNVKPFIYIFIPISFITICNQYVYNIININMYMTNQYELVRNIFIYIYIYVCIYICYN